VNLLSGQQGWRIGVDIGGTFTDLVLLAPDRTLRVLKVPTVQQNPSDGVVRALDSAATREGMTTRDLLDHCVMFVHGSTIATNTVLEGKGARTALLTTDGFRDALEIRRGQRDNPWKHREPYPPVLVPRSLRRPVRGRLDRTGAEREPVQFADVDDALGRFREERIESVAVCLFNSYLNDSHERDVVDRLREREFNGTISVSSAVAPVIGEFERSSTTVLNAYVAPRTLAYLKNLNARLVALGLASPLLLVQSNGGTISLDELGERPVTLLLSGPASGVGALDHYRTAIGSDDLVSMEIGGTSCDVILMTRGDVSFTDLLDIAGYKCITPAVEVHTIGAGGGTIAHVDAAGMLHIGPEGAGADPGPACYGLGGQAATVTDAQVVLGRLRPGAYAGGAVRMDRGLAYAVIERAIATPLRVSVERAASGIIALMDQKLLHAVQRMSSERGHDPRRLTLVAAGGAGPLHVASIARALGCRHAFVPRLSGAFCAIGMLNANVRHDFFRMYFAELGDESAPELEPEFLPLEAQARQALVREGFSEELIRVERSLDLRYRGQQWDITVRIEQPLDGRAIRSNFETEHDRLFGHMQPEGTIEITKLRVTGIGRIDPLMHVEPPAAVRPARAREMRNVWISLEAGWQRTAVYNGSDLQPGHSMEGPLIVDEQTTTLFIGDRDRLTIDATGNYRIAIAER
jgi:N-methylhydantoinase A